MVEKKPEVVIDNATGDSIELHSQLRRRTISVLVENNVGALSSIVGLFSARGYNIDSLCVAPTENNKFSRLTIVSVCYDETIEQIKKHLNKLIDVHTVRNLTDESHVSRELLIVKLLAETTEQKEAIKHLTDIFRARVIDVTDQTYIVEVTGHYKKTKAFINAINPDWILETVFSGVNAMGKGSSSKTGFWKPVIEYKNQLLSEMEDQNSTQTRKQTKGQSKRTGKSASPRASRKTVVAKGKTSLKS